MHAFQWMGRCAVAAAAVLMAWQAAAQVPDTLYRSNFENVTDAPASDAEAARFLTQATFGPTRSEIARLRATSEGTVKAQTNAIYRKAGVTGRPQLLSLFIEDLMRDDGSVRPVPVDPAPPMAAVSAK